MRINASLTAQTLTLFATAPRRAQAVDPAAAGARAPSTAQSAGPAGRGAGSDLRAQIPTGEIRRLPGGGISNNGKLPVDAAARNAEYRASVARAEAEFAKVEAEQRAFEAEHGFTQRATDVLRNTYYEARAGALPQQTFSSRDDALTFALERTSDIRDAVRSIALDARRSTESWLTDVAEKLGAKEAKRLTAMSKDSAEAGRMEAFIADTLLSGAFDVSGPTHTLDGADSRLEAFTVSWRGQTLLAFDPDLGEFVQFDARGTPLIPDGARRPDGGQPRDDSQSPRVDIQA